MGETGAQVSEHTDLLAGRRGERARWVLSVLNFIRTNGIDALDFATVHPHFVLPENAPEIDEDLLRTAWGTAARRLGGGAVVATEEPSDTELDVLVEVESGRRFWLMLSVEPAEPHRLTRWTTAPAVPAGITIRRAEPRDATALATLEREAPIVLGTTSMRFEHEADYFAPWALLEEAGAVIATSGDAVLAAVQNAVVPIRIGGTLYRAGYAHRVRTHPDHAGLGLLQHLTRAGLEVMPVGEGQDSGGVDCLVVCIGKDNEAMLKGWAGRPGEWPVGPTRLLIDTADRRAVRGRPIETGADLNRAVSCFNATHEGDEGYVPYTVESLHRRLRRAPHLYGPQSLAALGGAVVGTWDAGTTLRTVITTVNAEVVQRRAIVADWGVQSDHDDDLRDLLSVVCARLAARGLTHLAVYTSRNTPGWDVLSSMASGRDEFHMWTPGLSPAQDADQRGAYVDALAF